MDLVGEIGFAAGEIYSAGKDKETNITKLKKDVNRDDKLFYMGLGWLAREGKAQINQMKGKTTVKIVA